MTRSAHEDARLDRTTPLHPANAVAAVITVQGEYLLQLRDSKPGIFFPAHWGCFGGAAESGETQEQTLARELHEELALALEPDAFRYFTRFDFDLGFARLPPIWRYFYELELSASSLRQVRLGEGAEFRLFKAKDILTGTVPLTPYDAFALWFHINRDRLRG
jgi:8-oxo-dGTP pyrophosphatase MutT (NUDIX family)